MTKRSAYTLAERLGLNREEAAAYVGFSATTFDEMVTEGTMPQPKKYGERVVWDRHALDASFKALPDRTHKRERRFGEISNENKVA